MKTSDPPIITEQAFDASPGNVWSAISDPDQMVQWFFENIPDFKTEVGFQTSFEVESGGRKFPHEWTVVEVIPQRKLKYRWRYDTYPGDSFVSFELSAGEAKTKLRVTVEIVEDFPSDIPEFERKSGVAGWKYFIQERLKEFLDGHY